MVPERQKPAIGSALQLKIILPRRIVRVRQNGTNNFFMVQVLPRITVRVRQSVAIRFLTEVSLVDFGCVSKKEG